MYQPSRIILSTCLRGVLSFKTIKVESIIQVFPLDTLLNFILFSIKASVNTWEKSLSQKSIEGNQDVIKIFEIFVSSISYLKKNHLVIKLVY